LNGNSDVDLLLPGPGFILYYLVVQGSVDPLLEWNYLILVTVPACSKSLIFCRMFQVFSQLHGHIYCSSRTDCWVDTTTPTVAYPGYNNLLLWQWLLSASSNLHDLNKAIFHYYRECASQQYETKRS